MKRAVKPASVETVNEIGSPESAKYSKEKTYNTHHQFKQEQMSLKNPNPNPKHEIAAPLSFPLQLGTTKLLVILSIPL